MSAYDVILVGAGHNGLVAATRLARAGLKHARSRTPIAGRRRSNHRRADLRLSMLDAGSHGAAGSGGGERSAPCRTRARDDRSRSVSLRTASRRAKSGFEPRRRGDRSEHSAFSERGCAPLRRVQSRHRSSRLVRVFSHGELPSGDRTFDPRATCGRCWGWRAGFAGSEKKTHIGCCGGRPCRRLTSSPSGSNRSRSGQCLRPAASSAQLWGRDRRAAQRSS